MQDLNLIRKVAWSFAKSTGLDYDELFAEASLAYLKAVKTHDPTKARLSTWTTSVMINSLRSFCKKERQYIAFAEEPYEHEWEKILPGKFNQENHYIFKEWIEHLPEDLQLICKAIFEAPEEILSTSPKATRGKLIRKLRKQKWTWERIWNGIREMKSSLSEFENDCIIQ